MKPVFILDRDGVINKKAPEGDYIKSIKEFEFIPKAIEAIKMLSDLGDVYVVTNQRGVARGLMTRESVNSVNRFMFVEI